MALAPDKDLPPGLPTPGETFAGKYRIDGLLGVGGMGAVLAATHIDLEERVAIKVMLPQVETDQAVAARFLREARAAVKVRSEHVVKVLDFGTIDGGRPYMVMEYLEGEDLGAMLARRGPFPVAEVVDYVLQACDAVAHAHAEGIVHRDVKPSNFFLAERADGSTCLKLLDFGIAKTLGVPREPGALSLTSTQSVVGSPLYMAPEQMRSSPAIDVRTDIWSLGVVAYELLTGTLPFVAQAMPELCAMILQDPPNSLLAARPDAPPELERVIFKCLEKSPSKRFVDLADFGAALAPFGHSEATEQADRVSRALRATHRISGPSLPAETSSPSLSPAFDPRTAQTWTGGVPPSTSKAPRLAAIAGTVLGAAVLLVFLSLRNTSAPRVVPILTAPASAAVTDTSASAETTAQPAPPAAPPSSAVAPEPSARTPARNDVHPPPKATTPHPGKPTDDSHRRAPSRFE